MAINSIFFPITMKLYETDLYELQTFIANEKIEGEITEKYLILFNFAEDCRYSEWIQAELIRYLLPFYCKAIEQAVIYEDKIAREVYMQFNSAIFLKRKNFQLALGEDNYQFMMEYYMKQTIWCMEMEHAGILDWVPLFNTTVAFGKENLLRLFQRIFEGSFKVKCSFFRYLSVLLFKENDNLLAMNETRAYWTSDIWNFDSQLSEDFYWDKDIVAYFDKEIGRERVEGLFQEVKEFIEHFLGDELLQLFAMEMEQSFNTGVFHGRKTEYLQKISCKSEKYKYWDNCF